MSERTRLEITCPNGNPFDSKVILNGQELPGLCSLSFELKPTHLTVVMIELLVGELAVDTSIIERLFDGAPPKPKPVVRRWLLWLQRDVIDMDFGIERIIERVHRIGGRVVWYGSADPAMCIELPGHVEADEVKGWFAVESVDSQPLPADER